MTFDSHQDDTGPGQGPAPDGGTSPGFDEAALYTVVHAAVKDALLDVIGTLLLVGIAFVLVVTGARALLSATSTPRLVAGLGFVAVGLYLAAATLELVPPLREWT